MINDTLKKSSLRAFKAAKKGKRLILFGAGWRWLEYRDDILDEGDDLVYVVDNDPGIQGGKWYGLDIHKPGKLGEEEAGGFVVLITPIYVLECAAQLEGMGIFDYFALYLFHDYFIALGIQRNFFRQDRETSVYTGRKLTANLYIIDICNLQCKMCLPQVPKKSPKNSKGEMPYDKVMSILDQISELKDMVDVGSVLYSAHGEALLHSRFADIVRETKKRNLNVQTVTNGVLLKGEVAAALLAADAEISVSITGIIPEIYKDFQGYAPTMERTKHILDTVLENITELVDMKANLNSNSRIGVIYIVTPANAGHFVDYLSFFTKLGVAITVTMLSDPNSSPPDSAQLSYKKATGEGYEKQWADKKGGYFNSLSCFFPFVINEHGDVIPCCQWIPSIPPPILGNVHENSLAKMLFSESTLDMIQAIDTLDIDKMPEFCKMCRHLVEG